MSNDTLTRQQLHSKPLGRSQFLSARILTTVLVTISAFLSGTLIGYFLQPVSIVQEYAALGVNLGVKLIVALALLAIAIYIAWRIWRYSATDAINHLREDLRLQPARTLSPEYWLEQGFAHLKAPLRAVMAKVAFGLAVAALGVIVTNVVLLATLIVNRLQADRIRDQNQLLAISNQVTVLQSRTDSDALIAQREFERIDRILNSSEAPHEIVSALRDIPIAMTMSVRRIRLDKYGRPMLSATNDTASDQPPHVLTETVYPNLRSLFERYLAFARDNRRVRIRLPHTIAVLGRVNQQIVSREDLSNLRDLGPISTAILEVAHRLGIPATANSAKTLWETARDYDNGPIDGLTRPLRQSELPVSFDLDIRHVGSDFVQVQLPFALQEALDSRRRLNAKGVNLSDSNFSGAMFQNCDLTETNFTGASLPGAMLFSPLIDTKFIRADLRGTTIASGRMAGASFLWSQMQGATISTPLIFACNFSSVEASCSIWTNVRIAGGTRLSHANLAAAKMMGIVIENSLCNSTRFDGANLADSSILNTDFDGAIFCGTDIQRALFYDCDFGWVTLDATDATGASFSGLDVDKLPTNNGYRLTGLPFIDPASPSVPLRPCRFFRVSKVRDLQDDGFHIGPFYKLDLTLQSRLANIWFTNPDATAKLIWTHKIHAVESLSNYAGTGVSPHVVTAKIPLPEMTNKPDLSGVLIDSDSLDLLEDRLWTGRGQPTVLSDKSMIDEREPRPKPAP